MTFTDSKDPDTKESSAATTQLFAVAVVVPAGLSEIAGTLLFEAGAGGLEEREVPRGVALVAYSDEQSANRIAERVKAGLSRLPLAPDSREQISVEVSRAEMDWQTAWTASLSPARLTDDLIVCPGDAPVPADFSGRVIRLALDLVFGFGEHPTTRMAADSVERYCRARSPARVLDVGCGTGILSIVAALSGAGHVLGIDTDPRAVSVARRNALANGVAHCDFADTPLEELSGNFGLVVANIDVCTLVAMAPRMARLCESGGAITLTGFLSSDCGDVASAYGAVGFRVCHRSDEDDWSLVELVSVAR